ncbi:MAG: hypothetical protein GY845_27270 [Planctomycetes bacterium]|nr:hypothetical protein [Planctomycetota bacterium]
MKEEDRKKIEEIMGEMSCPKSFKCAESGFEMLCKAKDKKGLKGYLDCLDAEASRCTFAISFGRSYLCKCPLRVYLSKELKL